MGFHISEVRVLYTVGLHYNNIIVILFMYARELVDTRLQHNSTLCMLHACRVTGTRPKLLGQENLKS